MLVLPVGNTDSGEFPPHIHWRARTISAISVLCARFSLSFCWNRSNTIPPLLMILFFGYLKFERVWVLVLTPKILIMICLRMKWMFTVWVRIVRCTYLSCNGKHWIHNERDIKLKICHVMSVVRNSFDDFLFHLIFVRMLRMCFTYERMDESNF